MNVASLELCKELYELSLEADWTDTSFYWTPTANVEDGLYYDDYFDGSVDWVLCHSKNIVYLTRSSQKIPGYDLGYLLRKLHGCGYERVNLIVGDRSTVGVTSPTLAIAESGDTPEDAAATLAVELFKRGILTKAGDRE